MRTGSDTIGDQALHAVQEMDAHICTIRFSIVQTLCRAGDRGARPTRASLTRRVGVQGDQKKKSFTLYCVYILDETGCPVVLKLMTIAVLRL